MFSKISDKYKPHKKEIDYFINNFNTVGEIYGNQPRNTLKLYETNDKTLNCKSFKIPNLVNKIAYRFFRKSKAQRSFIYAHRLLSKGFKTPYPVAYYEERKFIFLLRSFYVSEQLINVFEYREMIDEPQFPNRYEILTQFTRFTYDLHEKGVEFLDHSPGNTLIFYNEDTRSYDFYLVDLNRMKFHKKKLNYAQRIKNFSRLTPEKNMVYAMSGEYAELMGMDFEKVFNDMWREVQNFQRKHHRKKKLKRKMGIPPRE